MCHQYGPFVPKVCWTGWTGWTVWTGWTLVIPCFREIKSNPKECRRQSTGLWPVRLKAALFSPLAQCWKRLEGWELISLPVADWKRSREKRKRTLGHFEFRVKRAMCLWMPNDANEFVAMGWLGQNFQSILGMIRLLTLMHGDLYSRLTWIWLYNWQESLKSLENSISNNPKHLLFTLWSWTPGWWHWSFKRFQGSPRMTPRKIPMSGSCVDSTNSWPVGRIRSSTRWFARGDPKMGW